MIWSPLERLLWGAAITIALLSGFHYLNHGRKRELSRERLIMFGYAIGLLLAGFERVLIYFIDFQFEGNYINNIFYGNLNNDDLIFDTIQNILRFIGWTFIILTFEISFKKTKYLLTTINILVVVILIIILTNLPFSLTAYNIVYIFYNIGLYTTGIIIYFLMRWSRLEFKAISAFLYFSTTLLIGGSIISSYSVKIGNFLPLSMGPILFIFGCIIMIFPTIVDPTLFSKALTYWVIVIIITISFQIWGIIMTIYSGEQPIGFLLALIITGIFMIIIDYFVLKDIRTAIISEKNKEGIKKGADILEIFSKPRKVTEDEVSVAKEREICLVCKGKLERIMYICPECNTFYCENCSKALADLENACWVCNTSFDKTKPSKSFDTFEDKIEIEGKDKKL